MKKIAFLLGSVALASALGSSNSAQAQAIAQRTGHAPASSGPTLYEPQVDIRNGGVLDDSYGYHRQAQAHQSARPGPYPPKEGWYGYGFPVTTYRWGWFGAERYYPRVGCRSDYNGDRVRWAYRYGY
jgi:hypothetical protein